ncbi:(2S)-3-sulfopropanediol dehydratase [Hominibacterium faecale]|uniref:(2S)-3-sulfopropanediol dehydratase n=1 Tax=Hominibacterium faecale TaxID=2839743 RepID=UPI0022B2A558|nr:formate C-acetyltransferase/glycerol dehydratase family glycyl radical enzyme [Hominibacterium faecale]
MNQVKPCGTERYDQSYGVGYRVGHDDFSPYGRVNRLRKQFLDREFNIDIQRARLITEVYKNNPDMSAKLKTAYALENILEHVAIDLYDEELIVGEVAAPAKAAPIYPEFSVKWIIDELKHHPFDQRAHDKFYITDEDRDELLEILEFWRGKTVEDLVNARLTEDEKKGSELGKKVYMTNLYHFAGVGHFVLDYPQLLEQGYDGYLAQVRQKLETLDSGDADFEEKRDFYQAMEIELKAACAYIRRYAQLAASRAEREQNPGRKQELLQIAENCNQIAGGPARTMWQAVQLWHFATTITQIESNGHSISYGRMDQWLYPYYKKDMEQGVITKEFAQELLETAYVKTGNPSKLKDKMTVEVRSGRGWGGESLTIGGVNEDGNDASNDLTFMLLEASAHTRMMNPWVCVRMHENTPYELKVKAVECIRAGYGHPKLFNDVPTIEVMLKKGMTLKEARNYEVVGCVEPDLPGYEYGFHDSAYMNIAKVMELALNGGACIDCSDQCPRYAKCAAIGRTLGPDTGSLADFQNIGQVLESFDKQMKFWTDQMCQGINVIDEAHRERKPLPYASAFFNDCIDKGKDLSEGGARYNFTGPQASGIATCADTLSVISQLVFDEGRYTGQELLQAIRDNWDGHDVLYALVNSSKVHHYGNDDDYADNFFKEVFNCYCRNIEGRKNPRGGTFCPGVYTVNANVGLGLDLGASLDGRKSREPLSDNMGPVHTSAASHDIYGPTAISNSVTKVDHSRATNGTLLNWKFPPECVAGKTGRENLISFIDTYFAKKAMHCQFNIMSTEMMRAAMKKPEDYKDMLVRVAGYSAYFVELGKPLQMDLINRTELSF